MFLQVCVICHERDRMHALLLMRCLDILARARDRFMYQVVLQCMFLCAFLLDMAMYCVHFVFFSSTQCRVVLGELIFHCNPFFAVTLGPYVHTSLYGTLLVSPHPSCTSIVLSYNSTRDNSWWRAAKEELITTTNHCFCETANAPKDIQY